MYQVIRVLSYVGLRLGLTIKLLWYNTRLFFVEAGPSREQPSRVSQSGRIDWEGLATERLPRISRQGLFAAWCGRWVAACEAWLGLMTFVGGAAISWRCASRLARCLAKWLDFVKSAFLDKIKPF